MELVEAGLEAAGSWLQGSLSKCPEPPPLASLGTPLGGAVLNSALLLLLQARGSDSRLSWDSRFFEHKGPCTSMHMVFG